MEEVKAINAKEIKENMLDYEWCESCGTLVHKSFIAEDGLCQDCFTERGIEKEEMEVIN